MRWRRWHAHLGQQQQSPARLQAGGESHSQALHPMVGPAAAAAAAVVAMAGLPATDWAPAQAHSSLLTRLQRAQAETRRQQRSLTGRSLQPGRAPE